MNSYHLFDNKRFLQCILIVLQIPFERVNEYDSIDSIDDVVEDNKQL
ncbi:MAG: hypothetical protein ACTSRI_08380 [Promethearchaeota archaeon]